MTARSGASGLSVCCLTANPPAQVAATLALLRGIADEIVVAADQRVDPALLPPLLEVADTVLRFEFDQSPEHARPWLVDQCHQPWVLMIDGDEVAGGGLVGELPELIADEEVVQCLIATRWCWPDAHHWLAERPWWPDLHPRLFRTGATLDIEGRVHGGVRRALPARITSEALYHLACVQAPFAERRARARRYEEQRPGMKAVGGGPMNDTLYVPEHFATLRPAETPADDVERIRAVLAATYEPTSVVPNLPVVSAAEIAGHHGADPLAGQGYRASLRIVEIDRRTQPGNDTHLLVEVRNEGPEPLPRDDRPGLQLRVGSRVLDPSTGAVLIDGARTPLPCTVPPGESRLVEALVPVPGAEGRYDVELDLINERQRWFGAPVRAPIIVASRWGRFRLD